MNKYLDDEFNFKISRFLFYLSFLYFIDVEYFMRFYNLPEQLWLPQGLLQIFSFPIRISDNLIRGLGLVAQISCLFCAFGFNFKFFSKLFFAIVFLAFNIGHSFGYQTHTYMGLVLASFALAFCGNNRIFCIRAVFCSIFFAAGVSKMHNGGLDWIFGESLQNFLIRAHIFYHDIHALAHRFNLNLVVAKNLLLTKLLAFSGVLLELLVPVALFSERFRFPVILALLLMQFSIFFLIFVNFKVYLMLYIFWVNWGVVLEFLRCKKLLNKLILADGHSALAQ